MAAKKYLSNSDAVGAILSGPLVAGGFGGGDTSVGAVASAPDIAAKASPYFKIGASAASAGGDVLSLFLQQKAAEEQARIAKEELALRKRAQAFGEKQYNDGAVQRGVNLTTSAYGAAETAQDWRDRVRAIVRGQ